MNDLVTILLCASTSYVTYLCTRMYLSYQANTSKSKKNVVRQLIYTAGDYFLKGHSYDLSLLLIDASEEILEPQMIKKSVDNLDYIEMKKRIKLQLESDNKTNTESKMNTDTQTSKSDNTDKSKSKGKKK